MKIVRFRKGVKIMVRASDKASELLFLHCSNGQKEVDTRYYNKHVNPLLFMHGVNCIQTIDKT